MGIRAVFECDEGPNGSESTPVSTRKHTEFDVVAEMGASLTLLSDHHQLYRLVAGPQYQTSDNVKIRLMRCLLTTGRHWADVLRLKKQHQVAEAGCEALAKHLVKLADRTGKAVTKLTSKDINNPHWVLHDTVWVNVYREMQKTEDIQAGQANTDAAPAECPVHEVPYEKRDDGEE